MEIIKGIFPMINIIKPVILFVNALILLYILITANMG